MGNNPNVNNSRRSIGSIINRVFESAGPDGKVRGTPPQIIDKYQALARDAQLAGDRVAAESFLQHSEHYSRMLGEAQQHQNEARQPFERDENQRDDARREDGQRSDGFTDQSREQMRDQPRDDLREQPREQMREQPRTQPETTQHKPQPVISSSLATIDPSDDGDFGGLIETPESAAATAGPTPDSNAAHHGANGAGQAGSADAPAVDEAPKPKRGRPRRKARPEGVDAAVE